MKRFLACLLFAAAVTVVVPSQAGAHSKVAPADEYFGKLKMSILGIRNTIKDVGANIEIDASRWEGLVNKADFTEDALRDWQHKYPADTWLPKMVFALERMYAKIDNEGARKRRFAAIVWLVHDFPGTCYARIGKQDLEGGHTASGSCE
ncbi:MAG: hypothetical protein NVSMB5_03980 [Candidatus Velthaea sp.]